MRRSFILAILAVLAAASFACAGAIQLPGTGQATCYDASGAAIACTGTGQDGEYRKGASWPSTRFTVSGDCVTDNVTGLVWAGDANLMRHAANWTNAIDYANGLTLCGYSDWRLPNALELESLIHADQADMGLWLNARGFTDVQSDFYWTSTTYTYSPDRVWVVTMANGTVSSVHKTDMYYAWPVRAGQ